MKFYNTVEAAELIGTSDRVVGGWCKEGKIKAVDVALSGTKARWQIPETEVERMKKEFKPKAKAEPKEDIRAIVREIVAEVIQGMPKPNVPDIKAMPAPHTITKTEIKFFIDNKLFQALQKTANEANTSVAILIEELLREGLSK